MSAKTVGNSHDEEIITNPLIVKQKEDIAKMRMSLLSCSEEGGMSISTALQNVTAMRIYHQMTRIVKYTEMMDKLEDKLYQAIDYKLDNCDITQPEELIMLLGLQEKLQKSMIDSEKLLAPYLDRELFSILDTVPTTTSDEADNIITKQLMSSGTRDDVREAAKLVFEYLPRAYQNGAADPEAREKMANASCLAGMAFANAFLGVCHSMAHKLGAYHHLPHGMANALLLDEVIRFNASEVPAKMGTFSQYKYPDALRRYADVAAYVGCEGKNDEAKVEALIKKIDELRKVIGQPMTIKEAGVDEKKFLETLDKMTEDAFDDQCTGANPRYPLMAEIKQMYLNSYYGKKQ